MQIGWDLEEFDTLYLGLEQKLDTFAKEGTKESEIVIDVTGGQKPNTVVAALVTVNRRAKFQYVRTSDTSKIIAYDLVSNPIGE